MEMKTIAIIGVFLSALLLLGSAKFDWGLFQVQLQQAFGFIVLSLSKVDFISNDPVIGGNAWLMTIAVNGQGQYAVGDFTADQIKDSETGEKAKYGLKIEASVSPQVCEYAIQKQDSYFWIAQREVRNCPLGVCSLFPYYTADMFNADCFKKDSPKAFFVKSPASWDYSCITFTKDATYGTLRTPTTIFKTDITLTSHYETKKATISNIKATSAWLDNIAHVSWAGNLVSGEECPEALSQKISATYKDGWRTIDEDKYLTYKNSYDSGFAVCLEQADVKDCIDSHNNKVYAAEQKKDFNFYSFDQKILATGVESGTENNGKVAMTVNKLLQFPVLTLRVKADWLGVFVPVGKPDIIEVSSLEFQTGSIGYIKTKVKNVGDALGSFAVYAECSSPFSFIGTTEFINLNPNEEGIVNLKISGTCDKKITGSCVVNAYDRNNPANKDSATVQTACSPIVICTPNEERCNGKLIEQCNAYGSGWNFIKQCDYDCQTVNGKPTCITPPDETCSLEDNPCGIGKPPCCEGLYCDAFLGISGTCRRKGPEISWNLILAGLFGTAAFLLIQWFFSEEDAVLRYGLAGIGAIIVALIVWWIVNNWLLVLLLGLGGLGIYLLFALGIIAIGGPLIVIGRRG